MSPGESQTQVILNGVKVKDISKEELAKTFYEMGKDAVANELRLENLSLRFENITLRNALDECQGEEYNHMYREQQSNPYKTTK